MDAKLKAAVLARVEFDEERSGAMYLKAIEQSDTDLKFGWFQNGLIEENSRLLPVIHALLEQNEKLAGALKMADETIEAFGMKASERGAQRLAIANSLQCKKALAANEAALERMAKGET